MSGLSTVQWSGSGLGLRLTRMSRRTCTLLGLGEMEGVLVLCEGPVARFIKLHCLFTSNAIMCTRSLGSALFSNLISGYALFSTMFVLSGANDIGPSWNSSDTGDI